MASTELQDAVKDFNTAFADTHHATVETFKRWTAVERIFSHESCQGRHAISFRQWATTLHNNISSEQIHAMVRFKYAAHFAQLQDDKKTELRKLTAVFAVEVWELYFLFGPSIIVSRNALKQLLRIKRYRRSVALDDILRTMQEKRKERDGNRSRHSRNDLTIFSLEDVTKTARDFAPQSDEDDARDALPQAAPAQDDSRQPSTSSQVTPQPQQQPSRPETPVWNPNRQFKQDRAMYPLEVEFARSHIPTANNADDFIDDTSLSASVATDHHMDLRAGNTEEEPFALLDDSNNDYEFTMAPGLMDSGDDDFDENDDSDENKSSDMNDEHEHEHVETGGSEVEDGAEAGVEHNGYHEQVKDKIEYRRHEQIRDKIEECSETESSFQKKFREFLRKSQTHSNNKKAIEVLRNITLQDLERLTDGVWLNDELINAYLSYLHLATSSSSKILLWSTFFYPSLTANDENGVAKWSNKQLDIADFEWLVVPIYRKSHWFLAIVGNLVKMQLHARGRESDETSKHCDAFPYVLLLDSLGQQRYHDQVFEHLQEYLFADFESRCTMTIHRECIHHERPQQSLLQENSYDCGIFLLENAERFFAGPQLFINQILHQDKDLPSFDPGIKRQSIRNTFLQLKSQQASGKAVIDQPLQFLETNTSGLLTPISVQSPTSKSSDISAAEKHLGLQICSQDALNMTLEPPETEMIAPTLKFLETKKIGPTLKSLETEMTTPILLLSRDVIPLPSSVSEALDLAALQETIQKVAATSPSFSKAEDIPSLQPSSHNPTGRNESLKVHGVHCDEKFLEEGAAFISLSTSFCLMELCKKANIVPVNLKAETKGVTVLLKQWELILSGQDTDLFTLQSFVTGQNLAQQNHLLESPAMVPTTLEETLQEYYKRKREDDVQASRLFESLIKQINSQEVGRKSAANLKDILTTTLILTSDGEIQRTDRERDARLEMEKLRHFVSIVEAQDSFKLFESRWKPEMSAKILEVENRLVGASTERERIDHCLLLVARGLRSACLLEELTKKEIQRWQNMLKDVVDEELGLEEGRRKRLKVLKDKCDAFHE